MADDDEEKHWPKVNIVIAVREVTTVEMACNQPGAFNINPAIISILFLLIGLCKVDP